jgi:multimeric flavodoxin WrbA
MVNLVRALGIVGSPRRGGNTETLVDAVLSSIAEAGGATEKVILDELTILPCRACNGCRDTNECVQTDDMHDLIDKMEECDVWILGTPVYWWGPTAQLKAFIDRWYGVSRSVFQGRRIILTIPMGGGSESYAQHTVGILHENIDYLGMDLIDTILAPGIHKLGIVSENQGIMERARQAGRQAVT